MGVTSGVPMHHVHMLKRWVDAWDEDGLPPWLKTLKFAGAPVRFTMVSLTKK